MTLSVDIRLNDEIVLTVDTQISETVLDAFISERFSALEAYNRDVEAQMKAVALAETWRKKAVQRLQFAARCATLSIATGDLEEGDED